MKNKSILSLSMLAAFLLASGPLAWSTTCTTSSDTGECPSSGAYASSTSISESDGSNTYVQNNISDGYGVTPAAQTLTSTSPESWSVSADFGSTTEQMSYPETYQPYAGEAVSSFTNIVSTFNTTVPTATTTASQEGFFIYMNDYDNSIEIKNYNVETSQCGGTTPIKTDIAFGGSYGVATEDWNLCDNGGYYWQYDGSGAKYGFSTGGVELISMIKYLETNGYLPSSSTIDYIMFGFFIDTTGGVAKTFSLNSYTLLNNASAVATPTFSPGAGTYTTAQSVTISDGTSGATIYYTTNDTTPTTSSSVYSSAIDVSATETLEALATHSGDVNSFVGSAAYTINSEPQVATPTFSPAAGSYTTAQSVSISDSTSGATIYYTTNDTTPTTSSSVYSSAIDVSATETLEALATHSGDTNSNVGTAAYTISSTCDITTSMGVCPSSGLYYDTSLSPVTWGQISQNDVWNPPSTWSQEMYVTTSGNWYAELNFPKDTSGAIHTYPSSAIQFSEDGEYDDEDPTLDSFTEFVTSWTDVVPASSTGTVTDVGFDDWMNSWANEVMVQTQMVNTDVCTDWMTVIKTDVEFGGSNGVPDEYWNLCQNGTFTSTTNPELVWQWYAAGGSENFGEASGTIDIYSMLKYLEGNSICKTATGTTDCLPTGSTFTQVTMGMEVNGTNGSTLEFELDPWTATIVQ